MIDCNVVQGSTRMLVKSHSPFRLSHSCESPLEPCLMRRNMLTAGEREQEREGDDERRLEENEE